MNKVVAPIFLRNILKELDQADWICTSKYLYYLLIFFVLVATSLKDATFSGAWPIGHDTSFSIQVCFSLVFGL